VTLKNGMKLKRRFTNQKPGDDGPNGSNVDNVAASAPKATPASSPSIDLALAALKPQTLTTFIAKQFPPKTPLIEGVLFKRDRISFTGRRRHGKTTALLNTALAGALGLEDYLGFKIAAPFTVAAYFLEDDAQELQVKINKMLRGHTLTDEQSNRLHIYTRSDFRTLKIKIDAGEDNFRKCIEKTCRDASPQLIILDNLGMLVRRNYNDSTDIHKLMELVFDIADEFDSAVVVAAHPRKQNEDSSASLKAFAQRSPSHHIGHHLLCC